MSSERLSILNGNMRKALVKAHEATSTDLPFDRIMRFEDALSGRDDRGEFGGFDSYECLQGVVGLRGFFRYLTAEGVEVHAIMPRLWAAGARWHIEAYHLSAAERRWMFGESDRAIAWRMRLLFEAAGEKHRNWLATASFLARTRHAVREDVRFEEFLESGSDELDGAPSAEDLRVRRRAVRAMLEFISRAVPGIASRSGARPALQRVARRVMRELWTIGRGLHQEPFRTMTMEEAGGMLAETKANHSHRGKQLSRMIESAGMMGSQLPGQKGKHASASYAAVAKRTCNRRRS